jgi:hypothetical protein
VLIFCRSDGIARKSSHEKKLAFQVMWDPDKRLILTAISV